MVIFYFSNIDKLFPKWLYQFILLVEVYENFSFSYCQFLISQDFLNITKTLGYEMVSCFSLHFIDYGLGWTLYYLA